MLELRTRPPRFRFVEEALERHRVFGDVGAHDLQRHVTIDQLVLG